MDCNGTIALAGRGRSLWERHAQAKPPAPPSGLNGLRARWGRHSACPISATGRYGV